MKEADAAEELKVFKAAQAWLKNPEMIALWEAFWDACASRNLRPLVLSWARDWQTEWDAFFPKEKGCCPALFGQIVDSEGTPSELSRQPHPTGVGPSGHRVDQVN